MNKDNLEFIIILLECLFILVFFGLVLPKFINCILYNYINKSYSNSVLVYNVIEKNINIIDNYIFVFDSFLK
ncbi:endonuclease III [Clostridium fermenticellae]|uniref:Endonuclease III n=1 Tax=Clostridium fermenticellae TaxID=2068654 RepID=A0A386H4U2_9CLOT|nr:endonuclease III [Clostridium fermenticellae]